MLRKPSARRALASYIDSQERVDIKVFIILLMLNIFGIIRYTVHQVTDAVSALNIIMIICILQKSRLSMSYLVLLACLY